MDPIKLSVRSLVELALRCGDIDSRYTDSSVLYEGAKAHRRIQKSMGDHYQPEVYLKQTIEIDHQPVLLQGRADGVFVEDGVRYIDEIKTTALPLNELRRQEAMHLGQAKCYAYLLLHTMENPPSEVGIQLTYFQLDSEELERSRMRCTAEEINTFFDDTIRRYADFLRFEREWAATRDESIHTLRFPYPAYRPGQRELGGAVYRTIGNEKRLYVQAPTGIGKTLSTLFPSIKAMTGHRLDKLFYLTAKTVTRTVAQEAAEQMLSGGLRLKSLTLRAKDKICFCETPRCNPIDCPYAKGHYDRINDALLELLHANDLITPAVVEAAAREHHVCPYELSLDVALWADLVICDYNHVFDPTVYLRRFFDQEELGRYVFLIDEAHNLAERVRDMYTTTLRKSPFSRLSRQLRDKDAASSALRKAMRQVNRYLIDTRKEMGERTERADTERDAVLCALLSLFTEAAKDWLPLHEGHELYDELLELLFEAESHQTVSELYDEHYVTLTQAGEGDVLITQLCLDPSVIIADRLGKAVSSVLFSATLTPLPYYRELLGGGAQDPMLDLPSPYDPERLLLLAHAGISTKYRDRTESYLPIAKALVAVVHSRVGNYLVYFPSYEYLQRVAERFHELSPQTELLIQTSRMNEKEREAFLHRFDQANPNTLVGFCVLGGIFSEGIDLKGDRLIGAIIVGAGLPRLSLRQEQIKEYFNRKNGRGYDYAYVFPGMNKVLQAAGRVIRSETDSGLALLIDARFDTARYRALFPAHWSEIQIFYGQDQLEQTLQASPLYNGNQYQ